MIATPQDVQTVRAVAINVAPEAIEPYIEDAEKQDVLPAIGAALYFAIDADPGNSQYTEILNGALYDDGDCQGLRYSRGLLAAVAYLAYARMLIFGDIQYTAFGAVLKNSQYSQKPGETDKIRAADGAKKIGFAILADVVAHIKSTTGAATCEEHRPVERAKFTAISKRHL